MVLALGLQAQSPHGDELKISCADCHNPKGWKMEKGTYTFDHNKTSFPLEGQHQSVDCKLCHISLVFSKAEPECVSCHTDMHYQTVGLDCARCHTPKSWIIPNITQLHQESRFPLLGAHATADCYSCHPSASLLRFEPLGVECFDCHQANYLATTSPNHVQGNYSTNCTDCHLMNAFTWTGASINHNFFPLTDGHAINDCSRCHVGGIYNISGECVSCHQPDYNSTTNPNHITADLSTNCIECHTTKPGWKPAEFRIHDAQFFPIYSGKHNNEWTLCTDCHKNPSNYAENTCIDCHAHNQSDMDNHHREVGGYIYNSAACLECHPTGNAEGGFNHNTSSFPLTGAHITADCSGCHANGYAGTTTVCSDCHINNYNQTTNPNHTENNIGIDCETCHTTDPEWKPATFPTHNNYYILSGAHGRVASDCFSCHQGNYVNSPNTCVGCHLTVYNQTTNPPHLTAQFSTDCETCHNNEAWVPSTFNHDGQYFPIYSGKHNGEWNLCTDCHTNPTNYAQFSCIDCHTHNQAQTDPQHNGIGGYSFNSEACYACHPTGEGQGGFNHNTTSFPLTGAHTTITCISCHANGYAGTPTECVACHNTNYNQTTNPNHNTLGISTDCASCHTTNPDWKPATFAIHNQFYVLQGAHASIANNCFSCHNGNYNSTPNTCFGCHSANYNQTTNPNHATAQFPTDCETCHNQNAWQPSTFNHDGQYFPIYSGKHNGKWDACSDCHQNPSNFAIFTCTTTCHPQNSTNQEHNNIAGYAYNSDACLACHPTGSGGGSFNHNTSNFPLTGAHLTLDCIDCHANGYAGTPTDCLACHSANFNQTTNPNHNSLGLPTDCATCHTTNPGWKPATFAIHNQFYPLTGGHATVAGDCFGCHQGNYNNTPNVCSGCHINNYNQTTNPNHTALSIPTDCASCHTTNPDWKPATFAIHNQYYILQGAHASIANDCFTCHNGNYNNTPNTCFGCHSANYNQTTNPNHASAQFPTDCETCHTQTAWQPSTFNHDGQYFPIYSGSHNGKWDVCSDCHQNPTNFAVFTCTTNCHSQNSTNQEHSDVTGYVYNSDACYACHPTGNGGGSFNHNTSNFPLTGAHLTLDCIDCHANGYAGTPTECVACHSANFNQTTNPNHNSLGLPTECATCHTTNPGWKPATFGIHNQFYPLTGGHATVASDCFGCHQGNYNNTPNVCSGCHINNYNQTTNPNHTALSIPTDCASCHTTNPDWKPATFAIHNQYYVLQGAHASIANDCFTCHNGNYNNTPNTCFGCHSANYNQTTNPNHASAQFPTDCETCHSQSAWQPSTFNHDQQYFPIYSGEHHGKWDACSDCHPNPADFSVFTCTTNCHPQNSTNQEHNGVSGYQYNSIACLQCHPNGGGGAKMLKPLNRN